MNPSVLVSLYVLLKIPKDNLSNFHASRGLFERSRCGVSPADSREVYEIVRSRLLSLYGDFILLLSAKVMNERTIKNEPWLPACVGMTQA